MSIWKRKFFVFCNFWVTKLKPFSGKVRKSIKNCLNQNLVIASFLGNGFEATLISKTNFMSLWNGHFSDFCIFLRDEVKTVFWERKTEPLLSFKFKFGHRKLLRKQFWYYLGMKNESSEHWKSAFFRVFLYFWLRKLKTVSRKLRLNIKNCLIRN